MLHKIKIVRQNIKNKNCKGELMVGFIFNFDGFKKSKKKINPFDLIDDFDYDFAESFEMDDYETYDNYEDYDEMNLYREDEID